MGMLKWTENWQRSYRISVGTRDTAVVEYTIPISIADASKVKASDYETVPSNARKLSNLSEDDSSLRGFTFRLNATHRASEKGSEGEISTLDLYNIDEDLISVINQDGCVVVVEAGYQDKVELAYSGDVQKVESFRQGTDIIHRLHCKSGAYDLRNTLATLNYDESMSTKDILNDMIGRLPNSTAGAVGLSTLKDETKSGGRVFSGFVAESLDKMAEEYSLKWSHFNGKIVIIPYRILGEDYRTFARTNYKLTDDLIKKVSDISDNQNKGSTDTKSKLRKLQINTFYIPIEIGQFVTIPETEYTKETFGTYQVKARRLILESQGSAWDVVLEVDEIEQ
jgi:hypothetical protein